MARMGVTQERERGVTVGMHKPEEKAPFGEYDKACRGGWAERGGDGLRGRCAGRAKSQGRSKCKIDF
jgi:hypothetical protein